MAKKGYIDAYKCREAFYNDVLSILSDDTTNDRANEIIEVFDSLPSADVQEIVRCKDCKHLKYDRDFTTGRYCSLRNVNGGKYCKDDDFCSYGKRKDGNER